MNHLKVFETKTPGIYSDINNSFDVDYLRELESHVDTDISNIGKQSPLMRTMMSKMRGITPEEMDRRALEGFAKIKNLIQSRIKFLQENPQGLVKIEGEKDLSKYMAQIASNREVLQHLVDVRFGQSLNKELEEKFGKPDFSIRDSENRINGCWMFGFRGKKFAVWSAPNRGSQIEIVVDPSIKGEDRFEYVRNKEIGEASIAFIDSLLSFLK
jgi:hypothetical protein